ncbi:MAG: PQQ-binding-like beta-propeller repeat protein [Armatimonadaceae bacterium]
MALAVTLGCAGAAQAQVDGWLNWRGPQQTGVSQEKGLPDNWKPGGANHLWTMDLGGGGTPIVAGGRVYAFGYAGQGADLQEVLVCADAETSKKLWERRFNDFISDIVYDRYTIGSPCVDAETGNVYVLTSAGIFAAFNRDGKPLWEHPMMDAYGRLTFPNGRTGGPVIENDLVIVRGITANWGGEGPARDRLYAFDKKSGQLVWSSTPSGGPKDNSFAMPVFGWRKGQRVFYTGAGDGSIVCANARTGKPIWRYPVSAGGMNSTVVLYKDMVIGIHADENLDSSDSGRMVAIKSDAEGKPDAEGLLNLDKSAEAWRNDLGTISSSPVIVGNRIYQVVKTGQLVAVDADSGKTLWEYKLAPDQLHASPLYADGKLYVPMQNGMFYILQPTDTGVKELAKVQLAGRCIGAPSVWNGKVYVFSTEKLYCFGKKGNGSGVSKTAATVKYPKPGPTVALQIIPAEVMLRPGEKAKFTVRGVDANGFVTETFDNSKVTWAKFVPPTARVRSEMDADFKNGELVAAPDAKPSAGAYQATVGNFKGTFRGRVLPRLPFTEDFESFTPTEPAVDKPDEKFAYPPLPWIGFRFKFDVRELDGNKVLAKTLDNIFFQRATGFFGHPDEKNYTLEADVMTDGNRRTLSTVGVINQRYLVTLVGNSQELEISSNVERIKVGVPFEIKPKTWYTLKTRVDVAKDGSGVVRAKAWKKGDPEPANWTLEVPHKVAHQSGAPGLFGFSPQSLFKVYIDNVKVTPNK